MFYNHNVLSDIENLEVLQRNRLKQRAYTVPFESYEACKLSDSSNARGLTNRFLYLNGDWNFRYFSSAYDLPSDIKSLIFEEEIPVPSCWQLQGYERCHYVNIQYPFPAEPPLVPNDNPVGIYERTFIIPSNMEKMAKRIVFEGVNSAFELYINDIFAGYSEGSHLHSEFDINTLLQSGQNKITVIVYKWSKASYLECQDMFRYSGIIRDVYIVALADFHLEDCYITTDQKSNSLWELRVKAWAAGGGSIKVSLEDDGKAIFKSEKQTIESCNEFCADFDAPKLWSAENPYLYRLFVSIFDKDGKEVECSSFYVGFKSIEVKGNLFLLNGKAIKIRGVNRHESYPGLGQSVTYETMLQDIKLMKAANVNAVRTSHYQNDCRWLELCSIYGFYVIAEADLENHGSINMHEGVNFFADSPEWEQMHLDRTERMVLRDRNYACVIMWSLGNESGNGVNHDKMADLAREYDNTKPIHYEGTWARPGMDGYDVISNMYPKFAAINEILEAGKKPYFMCEYLHSMGTGPGNYKEYWELIYANPGFMGGCVWEWCDHAIMHKGLDGTVTYTYGGDHGEFPHDSNFCCDGLVSPDRKPHPNYYEMKYAYRPVHVSWEDEENFVVCLQSKLDFVNTEHLYFEWKLVRNGVTVKTGLLESVCIEAGAKTTVSLPISKEWLFTPGEYYVNIVTKQRQQNRFMQDGFVLAEQQIKVCDELTQQIRTAPAFTSSHNPICVDEQKRFVYIFGDNFKFIFDKKYGTFSSLIYSGCECVHQQPRNSGYSDFSEGVAGFRLNFWRAPTDNDMYIKSKWFEKHYDKLWTRISDLKIDAAEDNVSFVVNGSISPVSFSKMVEFENRYTVFGDGHITIASKIKPTRDDLIKFPCFGMLMDMPGGFDNVSWYGLGPDENYSDFKECALLGVYNNKVSQMHTPQIKPQESGNREDVRYAAIFKADGKGIVVCSDAQFAFKAHHFTALDVQNAKHNEELAQKPLTQLWINHKMGGLGSESCGFQTLDEYSVLPTEMEYSFAIYPININSISPENIWNQYLGGCHKD